MLENVQLALLAGKFDKIAAQATRCKIFIVRINFRLDCSLPKITAK